MKSELSYLAMKKPVERSDIPMKSKEIGTELLRFMFLKNPFDFCECKYTPFCF
jgi:hypothetical protein